MTTTALPKTSADAEQAARRELRGDWDENGTASVHLPREHARRVLTALGWEAQKPEINGWRSPSGEHYWHTEEALAVALVAVSVEA